ncbi:universal stress protein [Methanonatronarchaeum sp. AMET-Sl]|uniref:universal stress protein n=1 Tax=Methanonatronarchaeum sp. AMET-Sl TaxID=3037654 RepID=UPI00244E0A1C|nr:universal stress protein [Methanonatronarchaeum sp. AMET-Sl]WGI18076.1 universal stress protein [Methanonatronarchaeum sp. AMET-Sl]
MYKKILVPTDGSEAGLIACEHAFNVAEKFDSEIHVLYVVHRVMPPVMRGGVQISDGTVVSQKVVEDLKAGKMPSDSETEKKLKKPTMKIVDKARERGLEVVQSVRAGKPSKEIIKYAEDNDIDIIVMGSHGEGSIDRLILGSTTEKVLKCSTLPVFVVDTY